MITSPDTNSVSGQNRDTQTKSLRRLCLLAFSLLVPSLVSAQCVTANVDGAWVNTSFTSQSGSFTATFDATPSASPTNAIVGLSNGAQTAYASFAALVRFGTAGIIEAYNGTAYAGPATPVTYTAGGTYHFRVAVNISAATYSVFVTPPGGSETTIGSNFGFRTAATALNNYGAFVAPSTSGGVGSLNVCNFSLGTTPPSCSTATAGGAWVNASFTSQSGSFTATFDATPSASPNNAVVGLSNGAQTAYASFAALVRFGTTGIIEAYNSTAYAGPATSITFAGGSTYHFRLVVNVSSQTYSAYVTAPGGTEKTIGTNFGFRVSATSLNNRGAFVAATSSGGAGTLSVCNFSVATVNQVATPTFSPAPGSYSSAQSVSITTSTSGASIRYTTDGSTPTSTTGTLYSGPVSITATKTLKAIAYASGMADSAVASGTYTIGGTRNYTAAEILPAVQSHMTSSVQVNTKPHINTMTRSMNVNVYQVTTGVFAYTSSMAIDTDGSDPDPDPDHQGQTTWTDDNGAYLGAHHVPYYVLGDYCYDKVSPCPHFYYAEHNITGLQFALIFYNGKCIGAVFGDTQGDSVTPTSDNDSRELGEASVESAVLLGIPSSGTTGGVTGGVTVVIFSGSTWIVHGTNSTLNSNAQAKVQSALNLLGSRFGL